MAGSGVRDVRSIGESGIGGSGSETGNWDIGESGLGFGGYAMGSGELEDGGLVIEVSGVARSGIRDKWIGGTGWIDCYDNGVIVTEIEFLHDDRF